MTTKDSVAPGTSRPLFDFSGQRVVVSGASRGIGLAIARGFLGAGASVCITGRFTETLNQATAVARSEIGGDIRGITCDVRSEAEIARLVTELENSFGPVDVLVNAAGIGGKNPAEDWGSAPFEEVMNTNFRGAFQLSQAIGRGMLARKRGNQINICSLQSDRPFRNLIPYATSKAALAQMTRALAIEWGRSGVRVNGVAPGFVITEMTKKVWERPEIRSWGETNTPLARVGLPEDMVGPSLFLASSAAQFITGQILYVDGGFSAGFPWPL